MYKECAIENNQFFENSKKTGIFLRQIFKVVYRTYPSINGVALKIMYTVPLIILIKFLKNFGILKIKISLKKARQLKFIKARKI